MANNKDNEKNIATSTSTFSEEYIEPHPNKFEDETTDQQTAVFEAPINTNRVSNSLISLTSQLIVLALSYLVLYFVSNRKVRKYQ